MGGKIGRDILADVSRAAGCLNEWGARLETGLGAAVWRRRARRSVAPVLAYQAMFKKTLKSREPPAAERDPARHTPSGPMGHSSLMIARLSGPFGTGISWTSRIHRHEVVKYLSESPRPNRTPVFQLKEPNAWPTTANIRTHSEPQPGLLLVNKRLSADQLLGRIARRDAKRNR